MARPKKTAEELDIEMANYFDEAGTSNTNDGDAAAPVDAPAGDDAAMDDEIS